MIGRAARAVCIPLTVLMLGVGPGPSQGQSDKLGTLFVWAGRTPVRDGLRVGQVLEVTADGPAARAGLVPGDTLLALGGIPLTAPDSLERALAVAPADSPCKIVRARFSGSPPDSARGTLLDTLQVELAPLPPRLGAFVTTAGCSPTSGTVVDDSVSVTASVSEYGGLTFVALRVDHRGRGWLAFGPDSVVVTDGARRVQRPLSPGELHGLGGARLERGPFADWLLAPVGRDLAEAERSLIQNQLRPLEIPAGAHAVGLMVYAIERMASPVAVIVRVTSREYRFSFARPY